MSILAMARKDLRILFRSKGDLFFALGWPLIMAVLFGYVFAAQGGGPTRLRVAVVDDDATDASKAFVEKLAASGDFVVDRASRSDAETMVRRGQRSAYVVIKPGFGAASQQMFYGDPKQLEVGNDPTRGAEASMIEGLLMKHAMSDFQQMFTDSNASRQMVDTALGNLAMAGNTTATAPLRRFLGELDTFLGTPASSLPGNASTWQPVTIAKVPVARERRGPTNGFEVTFPQGILWGIIGCVMTFAVGLVSERVHGTFVRLQIAPLSRAQILGGKALACFASISLLQIVLLAIGITIFGVRPSSPGLLVLACVCASAAFVGLMMMIAGLSRTEQAAGGAGWAFLMPMALFGGAMMPQFVMPQWMQTAGNVSPIKWAILGLEGALWRGFTLNEMLLPCAILLAFGAVCFAIGVRALR